MATDNAIGSCAVGQNQFKHESLMAAAKQMAILVGVNQQYFFYLKPLLIYNMEKFGMV